MTESGKTKQAKAGEKVGPGKYVCIDCGREIKIDSVDKDLVKCPTCACETYDCFPITHIRPDVKTPDDAKHPPKR
ncbi:MAG: zinc ribbon-containing protein [Methanomicrobiales archaeon]|nr:zinc ribbon-containing protein [Methanomicrobiales archaeon]